MLSLCCQCWAEACRQLEDLNTFSALHPDTTSVHSTDFVGEALSKDSLVAELGPGFDEQFNQSQQCLQASLDELQFNCLLAVSNIANQTRLKALSSSSAWLKAPPIPSLKQAITSNTSQSPICTFLPLLRRPKKMGWVGLRN